MSATTVKEPSPRHPSIGISARIKAQYFRSALRMTTPREPPRYPHQSLLHVRSKFESCDASKDISFVVGRSEERCQWGRELKPQGKIARDVHYSCRELTSVSWFLPRDRLTKEKEGHVRYFCALIPVKAYHRVLHNVRCATIGPT